MPAVVLVSTVGVLLYPRPLPRSRRELPGVGATLTALEDDTSLATALQAGPAATSGGGQLPPDPPAFRAVAAGQAIFDPGLAGRLGGWWAMEVIGLTCSRS